MSRFLTILARTVVCGLLLFIHRYHRQRSIQSRHRGDRHRHRGRTRTRRKDHAGQY